MAHDRCNFYFSFWVILCLKNQKFTKKKKTPVDIIILNMITIKLIFFSKLVYLVYLIFAINPVFNQNLEVFLCHFGLKHSFFSFNEHDFSTLELLNH